MISLPKVETKDGVALDGLRIQMWPVLEIAAQIWRAAGQQLVVTSTTGGRHGKGSRHYDGLAVDLRTRYFSDEERVRVLDQLRAALGDEYDVVLERTHMHVEYDP